MAESVFSFNCGGNNKLGFTNDIFDASSVFSVIVRCMKTKDMEIKFEPLSIVNNVPKRVTRAI